MIEYEARSHHPKSGGLTGVGTPTALQNSKELYANPDLELQPGDLHVRFPAEEQNIRRLEVNE